MINYGGHFINQKDIFSVVKVLKSKRLTQGNMVQDFENRLKKKFKSKYCCVVSSGTAALHLSCLALGLKNSIILTTPNTFIATANSILYSNSKPDFVDIDPDTLNIDTKKLEKKILYYKAQKKKISAVIATDFGGLPSDWRKLKELAVKFNFKLINDNCHAIGAKYNNDIGYAVKYADLVTHSYHPVKNITTGEGGAILTNNYSLIEKVRAFRNHGLSKISSKSNSALTWPFQMKSLGFNYRLSDIQCALGISQLKKLDIFLKRRREIAKIYNNFFAKLDYIKIQKLGPNVLHAYHLYNIKFNFLKKKIKKNKIIKLFRDNNINLQTHYFPVHLQPYYKKNFKFKKNDFPESEKHYNCSFSLPIYFRLKNKDIKKITDIFKKI